jgi:GDP-L-fucose synthase
MDSSGSDVARDAVRFLAAAAAHAASGRNADMLNWSDVRVCVTGGAGFLGRVVVRKLQERGCPRIDIPRRAEFDLTTERGVQSMYNVFRPDVVLHLAAEVGGIGANRDNPGRFFYANMAMGLHLIEFARKHRLRKFVQVGTVCAYPKFTPVPFREDDLWNGFPEETNAPYGVAKKALFTMLDAYHQQYDLCSAVALPVNLYGPGDNFDPASSHVIPALIRKAVEAVECGQSRLTCWGTGSASREFLYVDDAAEGLLRVAEEMEHPIPVNLGTGSEISIRDLTNTIAELTGFRGDIVWDSTKPDGQPRRCLDTSRAAELLNWSAQTELTQGLQNTIAWYQSQSSAPGISRAA